MTFEIARIVQTYLSYGVKVVVVLGFNATLTARVISLQSVTHMLGLK